MAVALEKNENAEIANRLQALRAKRGNPSQKAVAKKLGIARRSLQNWEYGLATPTYQNAAKLAAYYETSVTYILYGVAASVSAVSAQAEQAQLAAINEKLDQILALLTGVGTEQIMAVLREGLLAASTSRPAVPSSRSSSRSGRATGRRRQSS